MDSSPPGRSLWVVGEEIHPLPEDLGSPAGRRRLAILVHGFNNDEEQARKNYLVAKGRLAVAGVAPHVFENMWELYWPGYVESLMPRLFRLAGQERRVSDSSVALTAVSYARQVKTAKRMGRKLAEYLRAVAARTSSRMGVVFIGHSLGCRLILEAVKELNREGPSGRPHVVAVMLMAAAVQVDMVHVPTDETSERLRDGRSRDLLRLPPKSYCLYSRDDRILQFLFPAGQAAAREWRGPVRSPEAVGRFGRPDSRWAGREDTLLGHGRYWHSEATTPHLASLFGVAAPRFLTTWPTRKLEPLEVWETPVSKSDL